MKRENLVSIIVPVYNVEQYLTRCIESILNQTYKEIEIILVNDGSTDSSGNICDYYATKDKRVKVIHKENGGLSSARNTGLNEAKGAYIGFIDSDDYINPRMFEVLYSNIIKYDADLTMCNFVRIQEGDNIDLLTSINNKVTKYTNISALEQLYMDHGVMFIISCNKLYKKELFMDLRFKEGKIHEDEFIIHRILYKCKTIVYTDEELYYYVQRGSSIMNTRKGIKRLDAIYALEERISFLNTVPDRQLFRLILEQTIDKYIRVLLIEYDLTTEIHIHFLISQSIRNHLGLILKNRKTIKEKIAFLIFAINPRLYGCLINR